MLCVCSACSVMCVCLCVCVCVCACVCQLVILTCLFGSIIIYILTKFIPEQQVFWDHKAAHIINQKPYTHMYNTYHTLPIVA